MQVGTDLWMLDGPEYIGFNFLNNINRSSVWKIDLDLEII